MSLSKNSLIAANYIWWCPENTTYTTATGDTSASSSNSYYCASTQTDASNSAMGYGKPTVSAIRVTVSGSTYTKDPNSTLAWTEWGSVIKVTPDISTTNVKNRVLDGFMLVPLDEIPTETEIKLTLSLEQVPDDVLEALFLSSASNSAICSKPLQRGWLKWEWVSPDNTIIAVADLFGSLKVSGFDVGSEDFTKPTVEFTRLKADSSLEARAFSRTGFTTSTGTNIIVPTGVNALTSAS